MATCGCTAWVYHEDESSMHELHQGPVPEFISHDQLAEIGVEYFKMSGLEADPELDKLRAARGYTSFDVVNITDSFPQEKLDMFFDEHLHDDEEIRLCLDGAGYFDLRSKDDTRWIRVHCQQGDLLIVPAGIYHRFTLDTSKYIKAMRLFTSAPKWVPYSRQVPETEQMPIRSTYLASLQ